MPPGGGGEGGGTGEQIFGEQDDPPATGHECRDEEAASRSPPPPLPPCLAVTPVASQNKKMRREDEQQGEEQPAVSFPEDVLIEILSRVPYVSLFHFKCVSKQWLALCSDGAVRKNLVWLLLLQSRLAFPQFVRQKPTHRRLQSPFLARQL